MKKAKDDGAKFATIVADADTGIRKVASDAGIPLSRYCNHGGKNIGKRVIELGNDNVLCKCPVKRTARGVAYKSGAREHDKITIPIAKKVQVTFGAQTVKCDADAGKWLKLVP